MRLLRFWGLRYTFDVDPWEGQALLEPKFKYSKMLGNQIYFRAVV